MKCLRCEQLVRGGAEVQTILDAYHALTNSEQMGERLENYFLGIFTGEQSKLRFCEEIKLI